MTKKLAIYRGIEPQTGTLRPEVALIVSTYQKPRHLRLVLASVALQWGVAHNMELVVTDDGSTDQTSQIVEQFAQSVDFPVHFTTHEHRTFQLARCRNEGAAASVAPYILFVDGDCILPPDFVAQHLAHRRQRVAMSGDCCRLDEATSSRVDEDVIRSGAYRSWVLPAESRRLAKLERKTRLYSLIRHRSKPKLFGGNVGVWRADFERVNGYDEDFEGWGCEDDDLRRRLRKIGLRIQSIMRWTRAFHIWHRREPTAPARWREGANVELLLREDRPAYAVNGLMKSDESTSIGGAEEQAAVILPMRPIIVPFVRDSERKKAA